MDVFKFKRFWQPDNGKSRMWPLLVGRTRLQKDSKPSTDGQNRLQGRVWNTEEDRENSGLINRNLLVINVSPTPRPNIKNRIGDFLITCRMKKLARAITSRIRARLQRSQ